MNGNDDVISFLISEIQSGHDEKMEDLYLFCKSMICNIAYKLRSYNDYDDLCQEGYLSLCNAAKLWKPEGGASFIGYAAKAISRHMIYYKWNNESEIRVPSFLYARLSHYNRLISAYVKEHGEKPSPDYLIEVMQLSPDQIGEIKQLNNMLNSMISLNQIISDNDGNEGLTISDIIPDPDDQIEKVTDDIELQELSTVLWNVVDHLHGRESKIIRMRYQQGKTLKQISSELGISSEAVRVTEKNGLNRIRQTKRELLQPYINDFIDQYALKGTGFNSFKNNKGSSTEKAAIRLDQLYRRIEREEQAIIDLESILQR